MPAESLMRAMSSRSPLISPASVAIPPAARISGKSTWIVAKSAPTYFCTSAAISFAASGACFRILESRTVASSVLKPCRVIVESAANMSSIAMPATFAIGATLPMFDARSSKVIFPRNTEANMMSDTRPASSAASP
jgi:hypothetical protein